MKTFGKTMIVLMVAAISVFAQETEEQEMQTLFGSEEFRSGGYGGPFVGVTQLGGQTAISVGGRGGWLINSTFAIGGLGYGTVNGPDYDYVDFDGNNINGSMHLGLGGLFVEYIHSSNEILHLTGNVAFCWGGLAITDNDKIDFYDGDPGYDHEDPLEESPAAAYFFITPSIGLEVNFTTFFRVNLEAGYRFSNKIWDNKYWSNAGTDLDQINLDAFHAKIMFKFGMF